MRPNLQLANEAQWKRLARAAHEELTELPLPERSPAKV